MVDMAVGVVMGAAVTAIVKALVDYLINPLIAAIFGKPDLNNFLTFTINNSKFSIGAILGAIINFLIIALAVYFCIVMPINKFRDHQAKKAAANPDAVEDIPTDEQKIMLLTEIRDSLAAVKAATPAATPVNPDATDDFQK